jgi:hypothetical protein
LFCLEHQLDPNGMASGELLDAVSNSFFDEKSTGKFTPRCVFVDPDPTSTTAVAMGTYRDLFESAQFVTGHESSINNFAQMRYV